MQHAGLFSAGGRGRYNCTSSSEPDEHPEVAHSCYGYAEKQEMQISWGDNRSNLLERQQLPQLSMPIAADSQALFVEPARATSTPFELSAEFRLELSNGDPTTAKYATNVLPLHMSHDAERQWLKGSVGRSEYEARMARVEDVMHEVRCGSGWQPQPAQPPHHGVVAAAPAPGCDSKRGIYPPAMSIAPVGGSCAGPSALPACMGWGEAHLCGKLPSVTQPPPAPHMLHPWMRHDAVMPNFVRQEPILSDESLEVRARTFFQEPDSPAVEAARDRAAARAAAQRGRRPSLPQGWPDREGVRSLLRSERAACSPVKLQSWDDETAAQAEAWHGLQQHKRRQEQELQQQAVPYSSATHGVDTRMQVGSRAVRGTVWGTRDAALIAASGDSPLSFSPLAAGMAHWL